MVCTVCRSSSMFICIFPACPNSRLEDSCVPVRHAITVVDSYRDWQTKTKPMFE